MNKLFAVMLLVVVLLLPAISVAADYPIPPRYLIDAEGLCIAPDAEGAPTPIQGASISYFYEKRGTLVMRCQGPLPEWAAMPTHAIKLDYGTTGLFCAGKMKDKVAVTGNYTALVYPLGPNDPSGYTEITCRLGFSSQDP